MRFDSFFTGKERDTESGLDYFKYRMYASSMGRWMSPDPSGLTHVDLANPQGLNLYNYVGNNPLTRIDLDGLCWRGFQWACHLGQRLRNLAEGDGFQTDYQNALHPGKASQREREESLRKELSKSAPNRGLALLNHIAICMQAAPLVGLAKITNRTVGVGVGGSGGGGAILGGFGSLGVQTVADPQENVGVAINESYAGLGGGLGAQGGIQFTLSTAKNISRLKGGPALDLSGSGGPIGLDFSNALGGPTTATLTVGPGVGGKGTAFGQSYTAIPTSINCKDVFR